MRHVHGYLNLQGWHHGSCDQTEREKNEGEKIPQNLEMALGLILTNSWLATKHAFIKIHCKMLNAKFIAKYKLYGSIKK